MVGRNNRKKRDKWLTSTLKSIDNGKSNLSNSLINRVASKILLATLDRINQTSHGSEELLAWGMHILAENKDDIP